VQHGSELKWNKCSFVLPFHCYASLSLMYSFVLLLLQHINNWSIVPQLTMAATMATKQSEPSKPKTKIVARWYFGGLGSAAAACCTHPLDLLKVLLLVFLHLAPFTLILSLDIWNIYIVLPSNEEGCCTQSL